MTIRPTNDYVGDNARTEGDLKVQLELVVDNILENPGGAAELELVIATGVITPTNWLHSVDTESDSAADDLTNMLTANHPEGRMVCLRNENASRVVTIKDAFGGAGQFNMLDNADLNLSGVGGYAMFTRRGSDWHEVCRGSSTSSGGDTFQTINAVSPDANGNFTIEAESGSTMVVSNVANGIELNDTHGTQTNNPHGTDADDVGKDTSQWNGLKIKGKEVNTASRADDTTLKYNSSSGEYDHIVLPAITSAKPDKYLLYDWGGSSFDIRSEVFGVPVKTRTSAGDIITFSFASDFLDTNYFYSVFVEWVSTPSNNFGWVYSGSSDKKVGSLTIRTSDKSLAGTSEIARVQVRMWASSTLPGI